MDPGDGLTTETGSPQPAEPPKPPNPSADRAIIPNIGALSLSEKDSDISERELDVATLEPLAALSILARGVQALADITGDVPATPLATPPLRELRELREELGTKTGVQLRPATPPSSVAFDDITSPSFREVHIGSPEAHISEPTTLGDEAARSQLQYDSIARKFFSKKPPPISINDYLLRLHRYCPMSTAVYLAAGVYIHRLASEEKLVPVTNRTVHRLLLASLRVAMKALEDLSYPHKRFAGVGGVSERELAKLEISLCYLTNFDLRVNNELLSEKALLLQELCRVGGRLPAGFKPRLPVGDLRHRRRTVT